MNTQEIMKYIVGNSLKCTTVMFQQYTHGQSYRFEMDADGKLFTINDSGEIEEWSAVKVREYFAVNIPNIKRFVIEVESNDNRHFLESALYNALVLECRATEWKIKDVTILED